MTLHLKTILTLLGFGLSILLMFVWPPTVLIIVSLMVLVGLYGLIYEFYARGPNL